MRLVLNQSQLAFREDLRRFYRSELEPDWRQNYQNFDEVAGYMRRWDRTLYRGGWSAPSWPREFGGREADAVEMAIWAEESAAADVPDGLARIGKKLVGPALMKYGSVQQRSHIDAILRGDEVWCQGLSEPEAGSDLVSLRTRAVRDGDGWL